MTQTQNHAPPVPTIPGKYRIVLVNTSPVVIQGLKQVIEQESDMIVCGAAEESEKAVEVARSLDPDVIVVDISSQGGGGVDLVKALRHEFPKLIIIALSSHEESFYAEYMLRAGASGFVTMKEPTERLVRAIRRAVETGIYVSEKIAEGIVSRFVEGGRPGPRGSMRLFSDREFEVFEYIGQGLTVRQIAEKLHRSVKTVEAHRENIKKKLHLESTAELLRNAIHWVEYRREL